MKETPQHNGMPPTPLDVDDVAAYIFKNYEHLLTGDEQSAYRTIVEGRPCSHRSEVDALLSKGELEFYRMVRDRLLIASSDQIQFTRCPRCRTLCRTPTACLCPNPECNHSWFEQRRDTEQDAGELFPDPRAGQKKPQR